MKKLETVVVNGHTVEIEAHREPPSDKYPHGGIRFVAKCGEITRESFMTLHTDSPSTPEQHAINIQEQAQRLAAETAGHHQNQKLLDAFFAESS